MLLPHPLTRLPFFVQYANINRTKVATISICNKLSTGRVNKVLTVREAATLPHWSKAKAISSCHCHKAIKQTRTSARACHVAPFGQTRGWDATGARAAKRCRVQLQKCQLTMKPKCDTMPQTADQSVSQSFSPSVCGLCCLWLRPGHIIRLASELGARLDVNDLPICLSTSMALMPPPLGRRGAYEQCQPFGPTVQLCWATRWGEECWCHRHRHRLLLATPHAHPFQAFRLSFFLLPFWRNFCNSPLQPPDGAFNLQSCRQVT